VSQDGVSAQCDIHVELDVVSGGDIGYMVQNLFCSLAPAELLCIPLYHWGWLTNWSRWIQLVRLEDHFYLFRNALLSENFYGVVKPTLSYEAPRAYDVGPDFYTHR
jgi:hypothetical protein